MIDTLGVGLEVSNDGFNVKLGHELALAEWASQSIERKWKDVMTSSLGDHDQLCWRGCGGMGDGLYWCVVISIVFYEQRVDVDWQKKCVSVGMPWQCGSRFSASWSSSLSDSVGYHFRGSLLHNLTLTGCSKRIVLVLRIWIIQNECRDAHVWAEERYSIVLWDRNTITFQLLCGVRNVHVHSLSIL